MYDIYYETGFLGLRIIAKIEIFYKLVERSRDAITNKVVFQLFRVKLI